MNHRLSRLVVLACLSLCAVLAASQAPSTNQAGANLDDPIRKQAFELYGQHKMIEAIELLEQVVAKYPNDVVAHEALGSSLISRASTYDDPAKRKADRVHARKELLKAQELGDHSDLCRYFLAVIPEDGGDNDAFSERPEVQAAMQRGEAAFARGNLDEAIKEYSRALELDPKLYYAALDIGDSYFRLKQTDKAGEWFAKAIQIDPNQETAYRYWADALMAAGQMKEARAKFIEGLVAYPYAQASWNGLNGWLSKTHLAYKKVSIQLPKAPTYDTKGNSNITMDPSTLGKGKDDNNGAAWLMYQMTRVTWHNTEFAKQYPQEKTYRHSLKEEAAALSGVATVFNELEQKKKSENPDPGLVLLSQLKADGLIEPYVLLIIPDKEIAQDFEGYQSAHRDKLIQFVSKYVVPQAP